MLVGTPTDDALRSLLSGAPDAVRDPYAVYDMVRAEGPCHWYDGTMPVFANFAEVKAIIMDNARFHMRRGEERFDLASLSAEDRRKVDGIMDFESRWMTSVDGDLHRRIRGTVQRAFTPRSIGRLEAFVGQVVDDQLDALEPDADGVVDLMGAAYRVPLLVIMRMVGAPDEDVEMLKERTDGVAAVKVFAPGGLGAETIRWAHGAVEDLKAYCLRMGERHRVAPTENVMGTLLDASDEDRLSDDELASTFVMIIFAGHETTTNLIGNGVHDMLAAPEQWAMLAADPSLAAAAVEEALRFNAPAQMTVREVMEDVEVGGQQLAAGTIALIVFASANRDPQAFGQDADRFDLRRPKHEHVGLGLGVHFCLGASVARLEGRIAFETLARRFPDMELAADPATLDWHPHPTFHGLKRLPVRLGRDRGRRAG